MSPFVEAPVIATQEFPTSPGGTIPTSSTAPSTPNPDDAYPWHGSMCRHAQAQDVRAVLLEDLSHPPAAVWGIRQTVNQQSCAARLEGLELEAAVRVVGTAGGLCGLSALYLLSSAAAPELDRRGPALLLGF